MNKNDRKKKFFGLIDRVCFLSIAIVMIMGCIAVIIGSVHVVFEIIRLIGNWVIDTFNIF